MPKGRAARCFLTVAALASSVGQARCAEADGKVYPQGLEQSAPLKHRSALDLPIAEIASSDRGCAILDRDFPGLRRHPMYIYFKSLSLNQIASMSRGRITPRMLAKAKYDFATANFAPAAEIPAGGYPQACHPEAR